MISITPNASVADAEIYVSRFSGKVLEATRPPIDQDVWQIGDLWHNTRNDQFYMCMLKTQRVAGWHFLAKEVVERVFSGRGSLNLEDIRLEILKIEEQKQ